MKNNLISLVAILFFSSCGSESQTEVQINSRNKYLTYQNIVILSDLSSRLDNRPPKDINEILKIVQFFRNECVKPGEKIGDKSSISFSVFSEKTACEIDIDKIKNLGEKQRFINSTAEYHNNGLSQQISNFNNVVKQKYEKTRNAGLDLISLLGEKIANEPIIKVDNYLTDSIDTTFLKYENHIYIFTDGYLEYFGKELNSQFYFGASEIDKIRKYCIANNLKVSKALEIDKSLCLPPNVHQLNKLINLHILETQERDKNLSTQSYNHASGQRDNEILEAVWKKWAKDSGFKSLEWKKY